MPTTIAHLTDQHIPYSHSKALSQSTLLTHLLQPDIVVLGGDLFDAYSLSRYDKNPRNRLSNFCIEISRTRRYLEELRAGLPSSKIVYLGGNHEARITKYLSRNAAALATLPSLEVPALLDLKTLDIKYYPPGSNFRFRSLTFTHGWLIRKSAAMSARAMCDVIGTSVACGHSHRMGMVRYTRGGKVHHAIESGCLCRTDQEYLNATPDWQTGMSVMIVDTTIEVYQIQLPFRSPLDIHRTVAGLQKLGMKESPDQSPSPTKRPGSRKSRKS